MFHMSNSFFRSKIGNMSMDDILKNNPGLAKQMAAAAAQAAGPGFGNFMGAAMGVPQMPPGMAMPMPPGMQNQQQSAGAFYQPPNQPMNMAQQAPPVKRREMSGPSGVDDILNTFKEVREAETNSHPIFSPMPSAPLRPEPPAMNPSAARAALSEIQSIHSDDMQSQSGSVATARTAGGGRRRKAQLPAGNTMSLNL
jgi:hypothetical protein